MGPDVDSKGTKNAENEFSHPGAAQRGTFFRVCAPRCGVKGNHFSELRFLAIIYRRCYLGDAILGEEKSNPNPNPFSPLPRPPSASGEGGKVDLDLDLDLDFFFFGYSIA